MLDWPATDRAAAGLADDDATTTHSGRAGDTQSLFKRAVTSVRRASGAALDLVFPPLCLACQLRVCDHDTLCAHCWRTIDFVRAPLCDRLGLPLPYDIGAPMISAAASAEPPDYDRARAVARYDGTIRDLIHAFKFYDAHHTRRLFARWLCEAGRDLLPAADIIVPVPLARWRLFTRRYNQAQLLAADVARAARKPIRCHALLRRRATARQVGLTRAERRRNVSGAFAVAARRRAEIAGKAVLLIDDVITTGATVNAAARALKKAGAARVDVLALAIVCETVS